MHRHQGVWIDRSITELSHSSFKRVHLRFVPQHVERVKDVAAERVRKIEGVVEGQYAAIYRDHPFLQPSDQVNCFRRMLENQEVRAALHLNLGSSF